MPMNTSERLPPSSRFWNSKKKGDEDDTPQRPAIVDRLLRSSPCVSGLKSCVLVRCESLSPDLCPSCFCQGATGSQPTSVQAFRAACARKRRATRVIPTQNAACPQITAVFDTCVRPDWQEVWDLEDDIILRRIPHRALRCQSTGRRSKLS